MVENKWLSRIWEMANCSDQFVDSNLFSVYEGYHLYPCKKKKISAT